MNVRIRPWASVTPFELFCWAMVLAGCGLPLWVFDAMERQRWEAEVRDAFDAIAKQAAPGVSSILGMPAPDRAV